jgi:hypothetical protein
LTYPLLGGEHVSELVDVPVDALVEMIKNPTGRDQQSGRSCGLIRRLDSLPPNVKEAVMLAMDDPEITNGTLLTFLSRPEFGIAVNEKMVQRHRRKNGCFVCVHGATG